MKFCVNKPKTLFSFLIKMDVLVILLVIANIPVKTWLLDFSQGHPELRNAVAMCNVWYSMSSNTKT
jgi:hypothetical protein